MIGAARKSITRKLLGIILLTTLVALLVALAAMVGYDLRAYHRAAMADIGAQADLVGRTSAPALSFDDARVASENLGLLRARANLRAAALYSPKGALFATYAAAPDEAEFPRLPEPDGTRIDGDRLEVFKRVISNGEILGTVYLRADYELYERLLDYLGIAALAAALAMGVALVLSASLQKLVTRPILAISGIARDVGARRDYTQRAVKTTDDELGVLADSFNDMLAEIERRTSALEATNTELAREVEERIRAERENLRLNAELEARVAERTAQLESANQELEAFSFSVSHDLRAPLRAIDGFSQALIEDCLQDIPEEGRRHLARIRAATLRMGQLIEDLLALSRVSRGALQKAEVDMSALARQIGAELRQREPRKGVELYVWDGMKALGDPRLLRAALENLIGNAWKFTSKAPKPRIEVGALPDAAQTTYFVRDNGAGFDMKYANKLFGAFQRLHSMNDFPGTGIGLATVQRIVHRHGGRIWASAEVGAGATFFFTLAAAAPAVLESDAAQGAAEHRAGAGQSP